MTTQQQQQHCTPKGLLHCTAMSEPQAGCRNTLHAASYRELQHTLKAPPGLAGALPDGTTPFTSALHCQPCQPPLSSSWMQQTFNFSKRQTGFLNAGPEPLHISEDRPVSYHFSFQESSLSSLFSWIGLLYGTGFGFLLANSLTFYDSCSLVLILPC